MALDFNLDIGSALRYLDAEWGDRFSNWRIRRLKIERAKLRATVDRLEDRVRQLEQQVESARRQRHGAAAKKR